MSSDPKKDRGDGGGFDAVKAAEELAASLGIESSSSAQASSEAYEATLEREIEELNELADAKDRKIHELTLAVEKAVAARDAAQDEVQRASARIVKEELKKREQKHRKMLLEFLEVLDDFDRALESADRAADAGGHPDSLFDGIDLVRNGFLKRLNDFGVTHYPSMAEPFDPELHDAVTLVPVKDASQNGKVVAVVREGYMIGDECLRPARVAVGKH